MYENSSLYEPTGDDPESGTATRSLPPVAEDAGGETRLQAQFQRCKGEGVLKCRLDGTSTVPSDIYQSGSLKIRFPNARDGAPLEAVMINLGGGLTGGDKLSFAAFVQPGAEAVLTTQACEKIYRSLGTPAVVNVTLDVSDGAALEWLGQPTIVFDGGHLRRRTSVALSGTATFLGIEAFIFGREAMGESVQRGDLTDCWEIRRDGDLIHTDTFAVAGNVSQTLGHPAALGPNRAMATLRYVATDAEARLEELRDLLSDFPGRAAASAWNGMLIARFAARDGYDLTKGIHHVLDRFRNTRMPAVWSI
ncbi:urease accessory protein UreD [Pyruvatibacter sp. HU-CL02332]|uniref:urease accessory protein UreD n=1 Tax=Pyruvatibacter sp. HU-CL02332 TaxID=3127650 RepID=UPI00310657F7